MIITNYYYAVGNNKMWFTTPIAALEHMMNDNPSLFNISNNPMQFIYKYEIVLKSVPV